MSCVLHFFYDTLLEFAQPVRAHAFVLRCLPPSFSGQEILDVSLDLKPRVPYALQKDSFGNLLEIGRIEAPHSRFRYTVRGSVRRDDSRKVKEPCPALFSLPSPYTRESAAMRAFLEGLSLPDAPKARAWALSEAVRGYLEYVPGSTGVATTAAEAFSAGRGVCQDFAHVYLALARRAGLSARYVNGLPEGEGESHAWCEVWLDGIWTGIDPTRGQWADEGYLRLNTGRDFGDCPMERGVFLGNTAQTQTVFMRVRREA